MLKKKVISFYENTRQNYLLFLVSALLPKSPLSTTLIYAVSCDFLMMLIMISSSSFLPLTRKEETTDKIRLQAQEDREADKEDEAVF